MKKIDKIWKEIEDMKGTEVKVRGGIFSRKKALESTVFTVQGVRVGAAYIMDLKKQEIKHPTYELLLKNKAMPRARWSRPFPLREIKLVNDKWVAA